MARALGLMVAVALFIVLSMCLMGAVRSSYTAGSSVLELEGASQGFVRSWEGGNCYADVITEKAGADGIPHKRLGPPKYEPITLELPTSVSKELETWIAETLAGRWMEKSGALVILDNTGHVERRVSFDNARIEEVVFPACDGASKDVGYLTLKLRPERTSESREGKGTAYATDLGTRKTKQWQAANFRATIPGVDCTHVARISPVTVTVPSAPVSSRDKLPAGASVDIPNLTFTLDRTSADTWRDWFQGLVERGENGQQGTKAGTIEYLAVNGTEVLWKLDLEGLGIRALRSDKLIPNADSIPRLQAEVYCEGVRYSGAGK
jgi:hypothetical protein